MIRQALQVSRYGQIFEAENLKDIYTLTYVGGYAWPKIIQITERSCIIIVYTRCCSQEIKEYTWNATSFISHYMYKATYF